MKKIKELYDDIMELTGEITKDHVGAYAAPVSYTHLIVLARLRILQSLTWQLRLTHARLKQEHRQDLSVSQNTISFFALKSSLEMQLYILESEHLT